MKLGVLLPILLIGSFTIVVGNIVIAGQFTDFFSYVNYILRSIYEHNYYIHKFVGQSFIDPISRSLTGIYSNNNDNFHNISYVVGPRFTYDNNTHHYVTLTFYVQYGDQQHLPDLLNLLYHYNIDKAVFLVDQRYVKAHPFMINTLRYAGFAVVSRNNVSGYDKYYPPTIFQGLPLSGDQVLNHVKKDSFAVAYYDVALHYGNDSIVAFTPKIMSHKAILESILKFKGKDIIFTDGISNESSNKNTESAINPNYMKVGTNFFESSGKYFTDFVTSNGSRDLVIHNGTWTIDSLKSKYPSAISYVTAAPNHIINGILIKKNLVIDQGAELDITNHKVFLESSSPSGYNNSPVYIEANGGKAKISNSTVTSWDPILQAPDPNPFHPRPFIIAVHGGNMDILNSTISHLGFSIGGISDPRFAIAAISYYNTGNFIIADSTIAFNYYGFYSSDANNFKIVHNNIYSQTRYGLDPHTGSRDFIIAFNNIHDNGNQGIICSIECKNLTISNNLVENNVEGIGLHWLTNSSIVQDNIVKYNEKYGIFIQKHSFYNTIKNNTIVGNGNGIGLFDGSNNNNVQYNTIADNLGNSITASPDSQLNNIKENIFSLKR